MEIKAKELRIGNYVRQVQYRNGYCNDIRIVTAIREEGSLNVRVIGKHNMKSHPIEWFIPISLTEEWLLKFGFSQCSFIDFQYDSPDDNDYRVCVYDGKFIFRGLGASIVEVKNVHLLMNLYFALTQTELTIK